MGAFAIGSYLIGFIAALCLPNATGVDMSAEQSVQQDLPQNSLPINERYGTSG
jgi:hypothetical protein